MLAAQLRADSMDNEVFLEVLATKLSGALPAQVRVESQGGLLKKRRVKSIDVELGDHRYTIGTAGRAIEAVHMHSVRGVKLRTDRLDVSAWIDHLSRELEARAAASEQARAALDRLLA